ncbi:hypothetical protein D9M70_571710 [compost metagenome]
MGKSPRAFTTLNTSIISGGVRRSMSSMMIRMRLPAFPNASLSFSFIFGTSTGLRPRSFRKGLATQSRAGIPHEMVTALEIVPAY